MKVLTCLFTILAIAAPIAATPLDPHMRADVAEDIPLAEGIRRANGQFSDVQPLTVEEVIAAVKAMKLEHPDVSEAIFGIYMRIVEEQVLPRGVYFSRIPVLQTDTEHFDVDWKDLTLTALPPGSKDPVIGYGFNYRVRARFISSRPLTEQEQARQKELMDKVEPVAPHEPPPRASVSDPLDDRTLDSLPSPGSSGGR
jgi:hypothetical protein